MERSQRTKTIVAFVVNISVAIMEIVASIIGGILHLKDFG